MKKIKILCAVSIIGVLIIISCSKENDVSKPIAIKTDDSLTTFITAKNWKMVALSSETDWGVIDIYAEMDDCEKDDLYKLNLNGTTITKAMVKCDTTELTETFGTWKFSIDKKRLLNFEDGDTTDMEIIKLSANQLILKGQEMLDSSVVISTITFSNQ